MHIDKRIMATAFSDISINNLQRQLVLARTEINNLRQQIRTLKMIQKKEFQNITNLLDSSTCKCGKTNKDINKVESKKNTPKSENLSFKQIGTIISSFPEKRGTPRQPFICANTNARLKLNNSVFTNPEHAVEGLENFSHMWILFHFHKASTLHVKTKVAPPRLNGLTTGVFASRSPHRPNAIGLSLVKINKIINDTIYFSGVDMIDGTPVIDIKPYIPHYDNPINDTHLSSNKEALYLNKLSLNNDSSSDGIKSKKYLSLPNLYFPDCKRFNPQMFDPLKIPPWINLPPVTRLCVNFTDNALAQLNKNDERQQTIINVLQEDPRSTYLRQKWGNNQYVFRVDDVRVLCKFDDVKATVIVEKIMKADTEVNSS